MFMIGCDFCGEWYHGCCVGVSEEESNRMEVYKCQLCTEHHIATPFYNEGQRCILLLIYKHDSSHGIVRGHTLQQEVQSLVAWDGKNKCKKMSNCLPSMQIQILHRYKTGLSISYLLLLCTNED